MNTNFFKEYLKGYLPTISDASIKFVEKNSKFITLKKGALLVDKGEVPKKVYIISSGFVRSYAKNEKGTTELIKNLFTPSMSCSALSALLQQKPSEVYYDCITDCELIELDYLKLKEETFINAEICLLYSKVLELLHIRNDKRISDLAFLDATERYLDLQKTIPNIDNLIQQYHIAAYLNITPTQLSRIRKKLYSN